MSWIKCTFHVSPSDVRVDHARRALNVGEPVAFDDEVFAVVGVREDGSYDVKPHPKADEFMAAMLDPALDAGASMARAWKIGTLTAEEVAALP